MRAFVDWGVLLETNEKGIYRGASKRVIDDMLLVIRVIKAILVARGEKSQLLSGTLRGPNLFPFDIAPPPIRELESCKAFEVTRHGLDHEVLLGLARAV